MLLYVDNKGAKDLTHNWTAGGRTRHADVKMYFLREMKEQGLIEVVWIPSDENCADLFTKNLPGPLHKKHSQRFCRDE